MNEYLVAIVLFLLVMEVWRFISWFVKLGEEDIKIYNLKSDFNYELTAIRRRITELEIKRFTYLEKRDLEKRDFESYFYENKINTTDFIENKLRKLEEKFIMFTNKLGYKWEEGGHWEKGDKK